MRNITFGLIVVFISMFLYVGCDSHHAEGEVHHPREDNLEDKGGYVLSGEVSSGVRVIEVHAFQYGFNPDPIVVKKGEKVQLRLISDDVTHGLGVSELGVNVVAKADGDGLVEFVADKVGAFHAHCSVYCGPGHGKMHGALIVLE